MQNYSDSDPLHAIQKGYKENTRSLIFHSAEIDSEKLQEALDIIGKYNEFDSKNVGSLLLSTFEDNCRYVVGREFSVVIYVVPIRTNFHFWLKDLKEIERKGIVDEVAVVNGRLRLWWD